MYSTVVKVQKHELQMNEFDIETTFVETLLPCINDRKCTQSYSIFDGLINWEFCLICFFTFLKECKWKLNKINSTMIKDLVHN
jgi:hypothetical protein